MEINPLNLRDSILCRDIAPWFMLLEKCNRSALIFDFDLWDLRLRRP